jgi:CBS domain-containing protein
MTVTLRDHARELIRPPVIVGPDATLRAVARTLWENEAGAAVVGTEHAAVGIISERDVVTRLAQGADPDMTTAADAMTSAVAAARPDDRLLDVAYLMFDDNVRHVPVIDDVGRVSGMVSVRDLLRPLLIGALGE